MATKKKKEKESFDYFLQMLDNGITLNDAMSEFITCEKYRDVGSKYEDVYTFLGKHIFADVLAASESMRTDCVKLTITIEER